MTTAVQEKVEKAKSICLQYRTRTFERNESVAQRLQAAHRPERLTPVQKDELALVQREQVETKLCASALWDAVSHGTVSSPRVAVSPEWRCALLWK